MEDNINESTETLLNLNQSLKYRRKKLWTIGTFTILGVLLLSTILFLSLSYSVTDPEVKGFLLSSKCATDIQ